MLLYTLKIAEQKQLRKKWELSKKVTENGEKGV